MATTAYCTSDDIANRLSSTGVTLRTDDTPPDTLGDVITDASTQVDEHCRLLYTPANLAVSDWVNQRATDIAAVLLCERRGNPVPGSLMRKYERALERLEQVRLGTLQIPDVPARLVAAPVMSNVREQLNPQPHTRVRKSTSTGQAAGYVQRVDRYDALDYTI